MGVKYVSYVSRRASMVYVPTFQTRANFSFVRVNALINVWTCLSCANYSIWRVNVPNGYQFYKFACEKAYQLYNYFSKELFNFWIFQLCSTFANFKNIWAILANLSRETKNLNFGICKISLRKNLLKSLTSFSMEHVRLTKQLFS